MLKNEFNENFPALEIPENATEEDFLNLRNQQRDVDYKRIKEILRVAFQMGYSNLTNYEHHPPMTLFCLYRLLRVTFPEQAFIEDFFKSTGFPLDKLLTYAASGELPASYCVEILSLFSINSVPQLLFEAINLGNLDLISVILDNPHNDLVLIMNQRSEDHLEPMNVAAIKGDVNILNLLLDRGFPAAAEGVRGFRPIYFAARQGNYDAVVRLFEFDNHVTFNPQSSFNWPSPIYMAALSGHVDIFRFFLNQDTADLTNDRESTRLLVDAAVMRQDAELGNLLIDSGKLKLTTAEVDSLLALNLNFK